MASPLHTRKRKADSQDGHNERLSKRLSLLNLEHHGTRMCRPIDQTQLALPIVQPATDATRHERPADQTEQVDQAGQSSRRGPEPAHHWRPVEPDSDSAMRLDDSKHKVYIYNLDDELSSESEPEDGKLVLLPEMEKHLRLRNGHNTLPVLPNADRELADMQLVLYSVPSSLSVPEERDSVRKAIIEARARARARTRQKGGARAAPTIPADPVALVGDVAPSVPFSVNGAVPFLSIPSSGSDSAPFGDSAITDITMAASTLSDADAMDIDID